MASPGSLSFPAKKREAARIDQDNYSFAQRIMKQGPQVETRDRLAANFQRNMKTLQRISQNSRVSINKLVE